MQNTIFRALLWIQGLYTLLTALWGIIDIDSFMRVTGPKTDIWLVKTVSVVLVAIAACLLCHLLIEANPLPAIVLGGLTALGLAAIDFYYALNRTISKIYLADGVAEIIFLTAWVYLAFTMRFGKGKPMI